MTIKLGNYSGTIAVGNYDFSAALPVISGVSGNDAEGVVTLTTSSAYSSPVSDVTYNGVTLANIVEATATTITATMPKGGQAFGSTNDFQVTDGEGASNLFPALFNPRADSSYVVSSVDYAGLPPESIAIGVTELVGLEVGDPVSYTNQSGGETIVLDSQLRVAVTIPDGNYSSDLYSLDTGSGYVASSTGSAPFTVSGPISSPIPVLTQALINQGILEE